MKRKRNGEKKNQERVRHTGHEKKAAAMMARQKERASNIGYEKRKKKIKYTSVCLTAVCLAAFTSPVLSLVLLYSLLPIVIYPVYCYRN